MDPERWQQIDRLLQAALVQPDDDGDAFLKRACGDDHVLEREVRSLLSAHRHAGAFLDSPAMAIAARALAREQLDDIDSPGDELVGRDISHYRVLGKLGRGGMGVVFKAEDTRLHRPVALKFLSAESAADPGGVSRLQREARAASALNHPCIRTIYDVGVQDGRAFIAMEFLDGTTLRECIARQAFNLPTLLRVSMEVLDGLETAHAAGIIHRDITPANIMVTTSGRTKILDFGLANIHATSSADHRATTLTTTGEWTGVGGAVGTLSYMSPEQVGGQAVDARTDLFAFGVVLYEMATGGRPFSGHSTSVVFDAILHRDPPAPSTVNPAVSPELERIIQKCLVKDRRLRYQRASDIRADLQRVARPSESAAATRATRSSAQRLVLAAGAAAVITIAASVLYLRPVPSAPQPRPGLSDTDTIVVAEFDNTTGDPVFDGMLRQGLSIELGQSPYLSLVSDQRIRERLLLMGLAANAPLTPAIAADLCQRNGSTVVLNGSIADLGNQYVLALTARSCNTGDVLFEGQTQARTKDAVLDALSLMATGFRTRIGESVASVHRHSTALAEATTRSPDALKAYTTAQQIFFSAGPAAALPLYRRAVEIDPDFAMAHASLGIEYSNLGESVLAEQATTQAYRLRDRVSDRERFFIAAMYDRQVSGNLDRLQQTYESWAETYPRDPTPHGLSAGRASTSTGRYQRSIDESEKALEIDPDLTPVYASLAFSRLYQNQVTEAEAALRRAAQRGLKWPDYLLVRYFIAFLKGDRDGMRVEAAQARSQRGLEDTMPHVEALMLARGGRLRDARRLSGTAVSIARQEGRLERAALYDGARAMWEALYGNTGEARRRAAGVLTLSKGRDVQYVAALALARAGDASRPRLLTDDLERRFPEDTSVQLNYVPTLRALLACNAGEPGRAIELLQDSERMDFAVHGVAFNGFFGPLHSVYVRGEAYLAAGQPANAAREFQKIVDRPGIALGDPIDAMARLQLARALARSGDTVKARNSYRDLLAVWDLADAEIGLLQRARAEWAALP